MREEYNNVLSTPIEADNTDRFGRYRYINKPKYQPIHWPGRYISGSLLPDTNT